MLATRWNSVGGLRSEVDRLFSEFFSDYSNLHAPGRVGTFPALNMWEDEGHLFVEAELPGLKLADTEVVVDDNDLTIKGKRELVAGEGATLHRRERATGAFSRSLTLPVAIDADNVAATLQHGVLRIKLGKSAAARARRIEVKAEA
jgi:HSP20 family protein